MVPETDEELDTKQSCAVKPHHRRDHRQRKDTKVAWGNAQESSAGEVSGGGTKNKDHQSQESVSDAPLHVSLKDR